MPLPIHELRQAVRSLRRRPGFSAAVVVTVAAGVAAVTTVFSLAYGALLRRPPFPEPDRLVMLYRTATSPGAPTHRTRWSYARIGRLRQEARAFTGIAGFGRADWNLMGDGEPERVAGEPVTASYFATLGIDAALGRTFQPSDESTPGGSPVAVIGHQLWLRRFGGDSAVVGRTVRVNGEPLTIIGVMPPGFGGVTGRAEAWVPQTMAPRISYPEFLTTDQNFISAIGRLGDGVTLERAAVELDLIGRRIAADFPDDDDVPTVWSAAMIPLGEVRVDPGNRRSMVLLAAAVALLLVLACTNLAGLGLVQVVRRRQEMVVRLALGASGARLARQLLFESALLGVAGGLAGTILAFVALRIIQAPAPIPGPGNMYGAVGAFAEPRADGVTLVVALLACVATVILSGLVPALRAGQTDLARDLRERSAGATGVGRGADRILSAIVIAEVALTVLLAVGAGLLFTSLRRFESHPLGIEPASVLTFRIEPPEVRYPPPDAPALLDRVIAAIEGVPGVTLVTVDACAPLGVTCANSTLLIAGRPVPSPGQAPFIMRHYVAPAHFQTLGVPLLRGRPFTAADRAGAPGVAIINATAARRFWPGQDPLGARVWFGGGSRWNSPDSTAEVVGIVGDVPYGSLERGQPPSVYTPYRQFSYAFRTVMVRTRGPPLALAGAIRHAVRSVDDLPIFDVRTLEDRIGDAWAPTRFSARVMGTFGLSALLLSVLGVYGVLAHVVSQRTRELGLRMALGATPANIRRLVLAYGLRLAVPGVVLGVGAALGLGRLIRSLLYGVEPTDPAVLVGAGVALIGAALLAGYLPARRASRSDPMVTLRAE